MAIKSIEIICIPCEKCEYMEFEIHKTIKNMENEFKIRIPFEFKHTITLQSISKYSLNPSQLPAVIINGNLEISGKAPAAIIKNKLSSIHQGY